MLAPPMALTSCATAMLDTVGRPMWLSGIRKDRATGASTPIWCRTCRRSGRLGGSISHTRPKPDADVTPPRYRPAPLSDLRPYSCRRRPPSMLHPLGPPDSRHDRTFIPRSALHRHAVEPMVHWAMTGPPTTRGLLDNRAPTRHYARKRPLRSGSLEARLTGSSVARYSWRIRGEV